MAAGSRWSLRNIYLYVVCLITLIMVIVAAVGLVRDVAGLVYPDPGAYEDPYVSVDEDVEVDAETVERNRVAMRDSDRRWTILSLVGNVAMLLVAGPLYAYHWRKIESETDHAPTVPGTDPNGTDA